PAARDGRTWAFACPILSPESIAVTGIWADSGASVEKRTRIFAQQAPSRPEVDLQKACDGVMELEAPTFHPLASNSASWKPVFFSCEPTLTLLFSIAVAARQIGPGGIAKLLFFGESVPTLSMPSPLPLRCCSDPIKDPAEAGMRSANLL
ncbi:MAG: hypothetical protein ACK55R_11470, partial [Cyanobacteriota bacterium]